MYPSPGLKLFSTLPKAVGATDGRCRAQLYDVNSSTARHFAVGGTALYEIDKNGTPTLRSGASVLVDDGLPATMAISQIELCVCSGGLVFILNLATNVFVQIDQSKFQGGLVSRVLFIDSYFVAVLANSAKWQISGLLDGTSWSGADIAQIEEFPDVIITAIVDHNELVFGGVTKSSVWYNNGNASFPFITNPSAPIIEQGSGAAFARDRLDNSVFWIGADERGNGIAWKMSGYAPQRISTSEIEDQWRTYPTIADAVSYAYQMDGHSFWQIYFPSAKFNPAGEPVQGYTWVYDASTESWHEREFMAANGQRMAHRSWNHAFAFSKHLVGDWMIDADGNGKIYEMALPKLNGTSWDFCDDFGNPIIRTRVGPHVYDEGQYIQWNSVMFDLEFGLGPQPPLTGGGIPTEIVLVDSLGQDWIITVDSLGTLSASAGNAGLQPLSLNDSTNATSWDFGVDTSGNITATQTTFNPSNDISLEMTSSDGTQIWSLSIDSSGVMSVQSIGVVARDPQIMFSWSDDSGKNWSNPRNLGIGQAGKFKTQARTRMLGISRDRVPKMTTSDSVPVRVFEMYVNPPEGM